MSEQEADLFINIASYITSLEEMKPQSLLVYCLGQSVNNFSYLDPLMVYYMGCAKQAQRIDILNQYRLLALIGTFTTNHQKCFNLFINRQFSKQMIITSQASLNVENISIRKILKESISNVASKPNCSTYVVSTECCTVAEDLSGPFANNFLVVMSDISCSYRDRRSPELFSTEETLSIRTDFHSYFSTACRDNNDTIQYFPSLTIYRKSELEGFGFKESLHQMPCVYVNPSQDTPFSDEIQENVYSKLDAIFRLAILKNKFILVFQAFGEGYIKDPNLLAKVFSEIIKKYSMFFNKIIFSIRESSTYFEIFEKSFNNKSFKKIDCKEGSECPLYHKKDHTDSFEHPPKCGDGAFCNYINQSFHKPLFWHPPFCKDEPRCKNNDSGHKADYQHILECRDKGKCKHFNEPDHMKNYKHPDKCKYEGLCEDFHKNPNHANDYIHPKGCENRGLCYRILDKNHLREWMHPPICPDIKKCNDSEEGHRKKFLHPKPLCPSDLKCLFAQSFIACKKHFLELHHNILPLCKNEPNCLESGDADHIKEKSHLCPQAKFCGSFSNKFDPDHCQKYLHIDKTKCPDDDKCKHLDDEDHVEEFFHSNININRQHCRYGPLCRDYNDPSHCSKYLHPRRDNTPLNVASLNFQTDFYWNEVKIRRDLDEYFKSNGIPDPPLELYAYVKKIRPCHRCRLDTFKLVINHGCLLSKTRQDILSSDPILACIEEIKSNNAVKQLLINSNSDVGHHFLEWTRAFSIIQVLKSGQNFPSITMTKDQCEKELSYRLKKWKRKPDDKTLGEIEKVISSNLTQILAHKFQGVGNSQNKSVGTDQHVFCIVGPHRDSGYGDILLILNDEIMHHPDFNFTPVSGVYFGGSSVSFAPWLKADSKDNYQLFHDAKFNAMMKNWEDLVARTITAKAFIWKKGQNAAQSPKMTAAEILSFEDQISPSHYLLEGHMPEIVPLSYVKKIIIKKSTYDQLTTDEKQRLDRNLEGRKDVLYVDSTNTDPYNIEKANKFAEQKEKTKANKGLWFSIQEKFGDSCLLPLKLKWQSSIVKILFEAKGYDLHLSLSELKEKTLNSNNKNYIHFVINHFASYKNDVKDTNNLETYSTLENKYKRTDAFTNIAKVASVKNMNYNVDVRNNFVTYVLKIQKMGGNKINFELKADENWLLKKGKTESKNSILVVETTTLNELYFLSFTCWSRPVYVRNLEIEM